MIRLPHIVPLLLLCAAPPLLAAPADFDHKTCQWRPDDVDVTKLAAVLARGRLWRRG